MKVPSLLIPLCLAASTFAQSDWTNRFSAVFTDYEEGEVLSDKGAVGGKWTLAEGVTVRNSFDGERNGIDISSYGLDTVRFTVDDPAAKGSSVKVEFSLCVEDFALDTSIRPEGSPAALVTVADEKDAPALAGWTKDGWVLLHADGVAFEAGKWIDGYIELKTLGDVRLVSYVIKSGDEFVRLRAPGGEEWMTAAPKSGDSEVSAVSYYGKGRVSRLSGDDRDATAVTAFRWNGGAGGDWSDPANWTDGRRRRGVSRHGHRHQRHRKRGCPRSRDCVRGRRRAAHRRNVRRFGFA